jgi:acetyl esterase/lipase
MLSIFPRTEQLVLVLLIVLLPVVPAAAQVTIFSPFNIAEAMDGGSDKTTDVPYAAGPRHKLDVYRPDKLSAPAPVVMFIYGGSWRAGSKFEYEFVGRAFAAAGFVTVIADYRLWPDVRYPDFLEDNGAAMRWIQAHIAEYGGDPKRFFLAGHSAGAYNAVMLGLDNSFLHDNGVTMPIRAIAAISGPYNFYPFEYGEVRDTFGQAANPEGTQPINLVNADAPPMLLASGTADPIVRVENSRALAAKLRAAGLWVTEKYYEGFGHLEPVVALGKLMRFRMPILGDVVDFFQTFGAFPSGTPRPFFTPAPPEDKPDPMIAVARQMDEILAPIDDGHRED